MSFTNSIFNQANDWHIHVNADEAIQKVHSEYNDDSTPIMGS